MQWGHTVHLQNLWKTIAHLLVNSIYLNGFEQAILSREAEAKVPHFRAINKAYYYHYKVTTPFHAMFECKAQCLSLDSQLKCYKLVPSAPTVLHTTTFF